MRIDVARDRLRYTVNEPTTGTIYATLCTSSAVCGAVSGSCV